jgi:hypothetical protein
VRPRRHAGVRVGTRRRAISASRPPIVRGRPGHRGRVCRPPTRPADRSRSRNTSLVESSRAEVYRDPTTPCPTHHIRTLDGVSESDATAWAVGNGDDRFRARPALIPGSLTSTIHASNPSVTSWTTTSRTQPALTAGASPRSSKETRRSTTWRTSAGTRGQPRRGCARTGSAPRVRRHSHQDDGQRLVRRRHRVHPHRHRPAHQLSARAVGESTLPPRGRAPDPARSEPGTAPGLRTPDPRLRGEPRDPEGLCQAGRDQYRDRPGDAKPGHLRNHTGQAGAR